MVDAVKDIATISGIMAYTGFVIFLTNKYRKMRSQCKEEFDRCEKRNTKVEERHEYLNSKLFTNFQNVFDTLTDLKANTSSLKEDTGSIKITLSEAMDKLYTRMNIHEKEFNDHRVSTGQFHGEISTKVNFLEKTVENIEKRKGG